MELCELKKNMRAIYIGEKLSANKIFSVPEETAKHFIKVLRIKLGEEVLLISGEGENYISIVSNLTKKEVSLEVKETIKVDKNYNIDIALCTPKKDALELSLRHAVELGVNDVILSKSCFSQEITLKTDRLDKIVISAMEQSNNSFKPKIIEKKLVDISFNQYSKVILFSSKRQASTELGSINSDERILIVIGPEGGFSEDEEELLKGLNNSILINLQSPILRTPTAVAAGVGYVLSTLKNRQ